MPRDKTAIKTAKPSPRSGYSLPLGAHPGNTGGKKGRSGRRPSSLTLALAALRESPDALATLHRIATDPENRSCLGAWQLAAKYDPDNPGEKQRREVAGPDGKPIPVQVIIVREGRRRVDSVDADGGQQRRGRSRTAPNPHVDA